MDIKAKRFLIALSVAIAFVLFVFAFNITTEQIDTVFENAGFYIPLLGLLFIPLFNYHKFLPTKKKCLSCNKTLNGLLSHGITGTARYMAEKNISKYWNALYECRNCGDIYSFTMKRLCNVNDITKEKSE